MKQRVALLALLVSVFALSACAGLSDFLNQASKVFQQPTFSFANVALTDASLAGINLDTVWNLNNPNAIGISLAEIDYQLLIEDKQVIAGKPRQGLTIGANQVSQLHFPAAFKFQDIAAVVQTFLNKDYATWKASGSVGVQTPIGIVRLPLAKTGNFEVPKVPAISFGNPRVANVGLTGATIEFPLNVTNKNTYALPIGNVSGNLAIAGGSIGTLSTGDLGAMAGKGAKVLTIPLTVNFIGAASAAANIARGGQAPVSFNAQVQSGGTTIPFALNQTLNFTR